jgi:hypothetical protein
MRSRIASLLAFFLGAVALLSIVGTLVVRPIQRAIAPQFAVDAAFWSDFQEILLQFGDAQPRDPWGQLWQRRDVAISEADELQRARRFVVRGSYSGSSGPTEEYAQAIYSSGPNGVDEGGAGDDLYPSASAPGLALAIAYARAGLLGLAFVALVWLAGTLSRRRGALGEAIVILLMAVIPTVLAVSVVVWAQSARATRELIPRSPIALLPVPVVACGSVALVALMASAALRIASRPRERSADG